MPKKLITTLTVSLSVLALGMFSIGNALALTAAEGEIPLTSPIQMCKDAKKDLSVTIANIKAVGLSLHLSQQEIKAKIKAAKQYKNQVCQESTALKKSVASNLSNPVGMCKSMTAGLAEQIKTIKAFGLSLHLSQQEIKAKIQAAKDAKKQICANAKDFKDALGW